MSRRQRVSEAPRARAQWAKLQAEMLGIELTLSRRRAKKRQRDFSEIWGLFDPHVWGLADHSGDPSGLSDPAADAVPTASAPEPETLAGADHPTRTTTTLKG